MPIKLRTSPSLSKMGTNMRLMRGSSSVRPSTPTASTDKSRQELAGGEESVKDQTSLAGEHTAPRRLVQQQQHQEQHQQEQQQQQAQQQQHQEQQARAKRVFLATKIAHGELSFVSSCLVSSRKALLERALEQHAALKRCMSLRRCADVRACMTDGFWRGARIT